MSKSDLAEKRYVYRLGFWSDAQLSLKVRNSYFLRSERYSAESEHIDSRRWGKVVA